MKREKSVTKANVDLIVGNCLANQALEGMVCTPEDEAACRRIATGETTLDQELEDRGLGDYLKRIFTKKRKG